MDFFGFYILPFGWFYFKSGICSYFPLVAFFIGFGGGHDPFLRFFAVVGVIVEIDDADFAFQKFIHEKDSDSIFFAGGNLSLEILIIQ